MKKVSNTHIYIGLGTTIVLLGSAVVLKRILASKTTKQTVKSNFDYGVFDSPDAPGSSTCVDENLINKLLLLEEQTGYPIFSWINSGVRTAYWNRKVGGVSNSSHRIPKCKAVDIKASNVYIRNQLVTAAKEVGFKRIGVGKTFVHLDVDTSKSQYVAWGYPSGSRPGINPFV